jgi:hypothetical protein
MSSTKRLIEQNEEQKRVATRIAVEAGVLTCCDRHGSIFRGGIVDIADAYRVGNAKFSRNDEEVRGAFTERTEMWDTIKRVVENSGIECCRCAKEDED